MTAATCGVDYFKTENRVWIAASGVEDRIQCGIEQAGDQACRGVVAAGLLALVALGGFKFEAGGVEMDLGV